MMKERIAGGQTYGKWDDVWIEHPEPIMNEPHKAMSWLTAKEWIDEDRKADTDPEALEAARTASPDAIVAVNLSPDSVHLLRPKSEDAVASLAPARASARWAAAAPILLRLGVLDPLWGISDEELRAGAVTFTHEVAKVVEALTSGGTGFLLQHVPASEVIGLADGGERLPQKSTFYYPKLGTGLVFAPLSR